jgi:hypothetical protein
MSAPKLVTLAIATVLVPASVFASTECTKMPAEKWLPQSEVKTQVEKAGFTVQRIKQESTCYEVKGESKDGKSVKLYVNPADASIVREKVKSGIPPVALTFQPDPLFAGLM